MAYIKKDLADKDELQLVAIAKSEFGIALDADRMQKAQMVDAILEADSNAANYANATEPKPPQGQKKFRIIVHSQEGVDSTPFVTPSINGYVMQIPRDVESDIPQDYLTILEQAVYERPGKGEDGKPVVAMHRRFPFTVLGEAREAA